MRKRICLRNVTMWRTAEHSDEDNLRWCWLRAVEWGRWPIFISQPLAPLLLLWLPWTIVVAGTVVLNILWATFIRYRFVSARAAFVGAVLVLLKWVTWPGATAYLFVQGRRPECWFAASWPLLIFVLGAFPSTAIGRIQVSFMRALGYEPAEIARLSGPLAKESAHTTPISTAGEPE
jgi:hypothetical protein